MRYRLQELGSQLPPPHPSNPVFTMRTATATAWWLAILAASSTAEAAIKVLQGNDDGWAENYVRAFHDSLNKSGRDVVLSCPAENKSGTGEIDPSNPWALPSPARSF